jgi:gluconolactonase
MEEAPVDPMLHVPGAGRARQLVDGLDHPEGVAWSPTENAAYAGGEAGQIYRIPMETEVAQVVAEVGGQVLGVTLDGRDRVIACAPGVRTLAVFDGRDVHPLVTEVEGRQLVTPNYAAFAADGTLYFTDSGSWEAHDGRVLLMTPQGEVGVLSEALTRFPNGCAVTSDGRWLWVAESLGPTVSRLDLRDGGSPEIVVRLHGHVPDGLAFTADGGILISCYRPDRIYHLDSSGRLEVVAQDPHGTLLAAPTNVCFAGRDLDRVLSANLGRWHLTLLDLGLTGEPLQRPDRWGFDSWLERR